MWRANSLEETLMLGKIEGRRRRGPQRMRRLDGITDSMNIVWASSGRWWRTGRPGFWPSVQTGFCSHKELDTTQQLNNTDLNTKLNLLTFYKKLQEIIFVTFGCVRACSVASAVSDSVWPYGLQPVRLLCPWDSSGKNTRVGCHALLQGIFLTQGSHPRLFCLPISAGRFFTMSTT